MQVFYMLLTEYHKPLIFSCIGYSAYCEFYLLSTHTKGKLTSSLTGLIVMSTNAFKKISHQLHDELQAVESTLGDIHSEITLVNQVASHILQQGGKRIRPILVIAAAKTLSTSNTKHIELGAVVELIHAATLLHDDVIDNSSKRRHISTANCIWNNKTSILAGDFIYALAFQKMTAIGSLTILDALSKATSYIVEGEILQLTQQKAYNTSLEDYYKVIERKTARLFSVSTQIGAICAHAEPIIEHHLACFGHHFGMAYQMANDLQDYAASEDKNTGDDLMEGKPTLPFILAYNSSTPEDQRILESALLTGDNIATVKDIMHKTCALDKAAMHINAELEKAAQALKHLPNASYKGIFTLLCQHVNESIHFETV